MIEYVFKEIPTGRGDSYFHLNDSPFMVNSVTDCYSHALVDAGELTYDDVDRIVCTWCPEDALDILKDECDEAGLLVKFDRSEMEKHKNAH